MDVQPTEEFINRHTAFAVLVLLIGVFVLGYFTGRADPQGNLFHSSRIYSTHPLPDPNQF